MENFSAFARDANKCAIAQKPVSGDTGLNPIVANASYFEGALSPLPRVSVLQTSRCAPLTAQGDRSDLRLNLMVVECKKTPGLPHDIFMVLIKHESHIQQYIACLRSNASSWLSRTKALL